MTLIEKIFNYLILFCFDWKRKREPYAGDYRTLWKDPETGYWYMAEAAIIICERRVTNKNPHGFWGKFKFLIKALFINPW